MTTQPAQSQNRTNPKSRRRFTAVALTCATLFVTGSQADLLGFGILGPSGNDTAQKQANIQSQSADMLQQLYALRPDLQQTIQNAAGYATFKKTNIHLFLVASGNGYGMLVNNQTGQTTYMDVASLGGGVGLGVTDLRVVFVFTDPAVMQQFVTQGWQFGGNADANAQYDNAGVGANQSTQANVDFSDGTAIGTSSSSVGSGTGDGDSSGQNVAAGNGMQIYQFTESGIALQATISGTKYWVDSTLNN
ncbi:MAG: hypothetical protein KF805_09890 [Phycisphaeraceae bacterium]|nr:hypothetical protein [Phycisphaeraceae bacterium]